MNEAIDAAIRRAEVGEVTEAWLESPGGTYRLMQDGNTYAVLLSPLGVGDVMRGLFGSEASPLRHIPQYHVGVEPTTVVNFGNNMVTAAVEGRELHLSTFELSSQSREFARIRLGGPNEITSVEPLPTTTWVIVNFRTELFEVGYAMIVHMPTGKFALLEQRVRCARAIEWDKDSICFEATWVGYDSEASINACMAQFVDLELTLSCGPIVGLGYDDRGNMLAGLCSFAPDMRAVLVSANGELFLRYMVGSKTVLQRPVDHPWSGNECFHVKAIQFEGTVACVRASCRDRWVSWTEHEMAFVVCMLTGRVLATSEFYWFNEPAGGNWARYKLEPAEGFGEPVSLLWSEDEPSSEDGADE